MLVFAFVGQAAIRSTSEAALITVLSLVRYLTAISFHAVPHRRSATHSYRRSMAVFWRFRPGRAFPGPRLRFVDVILSSTPWAMPNSYRLQKSVAVSVPL